MLHISLRRLACPVAAAGFAVLASLGAAVPASAATTHPAAERSTATFTALQVEEAALSAAIRSHAVASPNNFPDAWLSKTQFLAGNPNPADHPSCTSRSISLRAGVYTWRIFVGPNTQASEDINLLADATTTWTVCLTPGAGTYDEETWFAGGPVLPNHFVTIPGDGSYNWGSVLIPHF